MLRLDRVSAGDLYVKLVALHWGRLTVRPPTPPAGERVEDDVPHPRKINGSTPSPPDVGAGGARGGAPQKTLISPRRYFCGFARTSSRIALRSVIVLFSWS